MGPDPGENSCALLPPLLPLLPPPLLPPAAVTAAAATAAVAAALAGSASIEVVSMDASDRCTGTASVGRGRGRRKRKEDDVLVRKVLRVSPHL
jgi:hypothetical protein